MIDFFPDLQQQLDKLSIYKKPMQFLITHVDFDVDNDDLTSEELALDYVGEIWEADDEDDLIDEITNDAEYCIKSIDYRHVLNGN